VKRLGEVELLGPEHLALIGGTIASISSMRRIFVGRARVVWRSRWGSLKTSAIERIASGAVPLQR
jgi:hypothetical protein